jgi:hypothetical protein
MLRLLRLRRRVPNVVAVGLWMPVRSATDRGWGVDAAETAQPVGAPAVAGASKAHDDIAAAVREALPKKPTPINEVGKLLPDDILDDLDVGLKQLFTQYPSYFTLTAGPTGALCVTPVKVLHVHSALIAALNDVLTKHEGRMAVDDLRKALPEDVMQHVAPFRTLTAALKAAPHEFVVEPNGTIAAFPAYKMALVAAARANALKAIIRDTPPFLVPLPALAAHEKESCKETYDRVVARDDVFDLVSPAGISPSGDGDQDFYSNCFVRVLPPFHDVCTDASKEALAGYMAEDFDAYRLARFLTTTTSRPIADLDEAAAILTKPLLHVIHSFPEMFHYDAATDSVRFILRPDMQPNPLRQYSDEELQGRIAKFREQMSAGRNKFEKKDRKMRLDKVIAAQFARSNPSGTAFMDANVLAMLIYDTLPSTGAMPSHDIATLLPEYALNTHIRMSRTFLEKFPHLFTVYQEKPPEYLLQRADVPMSHSVKTTLEDGRPFTSLGAGDIADLAVRIAVERKLEVHRPTRWDTVRQQFPYLLRKHVVTFSVAQIVAAKPEDMIQLRIGPSHNFFAFVGPRMQAILPANTRTDKYKYPVFTVNADLTSGPEYPWPPADTAPAADAPAAAVETGSTTVTGEIKPKRGWVAFAPDAAKDPEADNAPPASDASAEPQVGRGWSVPEPAKPNS